MTENVYEASFGEPEKVTLGFTDPHFALSGRLKGVIDAHITYGLETVRYLDVSPDISDEALGRIATLKEAELLVSAGEEEEARYEELADVFDDDDRPLCVIVIPAGAKQLYGERLFKQTDQNSKTHVNDDEIFRLCGGLWREVYEVTGELPEGGLLKRTAMVSHDFDEHGLKVIPESSEWRSIGDDEEVIVFLEDELQKEMDETTSDRDRTKHFVSIFMEGFQGQ